MPKQKRTNSRKGRGAGEGILEGLQQALADARGEIRLARRYYPGPVDVKAIRRASALSQAQFAERFGFSLRTLGLGVGPVTPGRPGAGLFKSD